MNIVQVDRDTCSTWPKLKATIKQLHSNEPQIIVATQMLVKSHHIANLQGVVVVDADYALLSKDFKALEHLHQQMHQVIGRAGREDIQGEVNIQTAYPDHPIWSFIKAHNYLDAANYLLEERMRADLPPFSYQALFSLRHTCEKKAKQYVTQLWKMLTNKGLDSICYKPMPAQYTKIQGLYGYCIVMQSTKMLVLQQDIVSLQKVIAGLQWSTAIKWYIELDPLEY